VTLDPVDHVMPDSKALTAAILETALDSIIIIDQDGQVLEFNPAAERTFGYRRVEVIGRQMADLIVPPALRERHSRGMAHYLATGDGPVLGRRVEATAMRSDGSEFLVELAITRIETAGPALFTAYLRDITERRLLERRRGIRMAVTQILADASDVREASERILEAICTALEWDMGAVWTVDREARVLRCMALWYSRDTDRDVFINECRTLSFPIGVGLPGRVWETRQPAWIPDVTRDGLFPRGSAAARAGLHGAFGSPIVMGDDFLGMMEFFSPEVREPDVDLLEMMSSLAGQIGQFMERKGAEDELRYQLQLFRTVTENAPSCLCLIDEQGHPTFVNPAFTQVTGYTLEDIRGGTVHDAIHHHHPDGRPFPWSECPVERAASTGEAVASYEDVFQRRDGTSFPVRNGLTPIIRDGRPAGAVVEFRDITLQKAAEQSIVELNRELLAADRRKDEFLATLAHELRNPLAPIRNGLEILRLAHHDPRMVSQAQELMERQMHQLVRLVDDLMDVSRISRGKVVLQKEVVPLARIIELALEVSRSGIEKAGHHLILDVPSKPIFLNADVIRLTQAFANIFNNAAKYTPPGGRITIRVVDQGASVVIHIEDTGIGISPELMPEIFTLFAQADRSLGRSQGGLGIGLTIVHRLIEMHGGSIEARSAGVDQGSEFIVTLPTWKEAERPSRAIEPGIKAPHRQRRVLIVDDNVDAAESLARVLALSGHDVRTVYDGESGIEVVEVFSPDLVLLDLGMPRIDGYETARRIRRTPNGKQVLLVALTGWGQEQNRKQSRDAGFDQHLVKPADPQMLLQLLASIGERERPRE
jgi:PAS domain S-box-containing protein